MWTEKGLLELQVVPQDEYENAIFDRSAFKVSIDGAINTLSPPLYQHENAGYGTFAVTVMLNSAALYDHNG